MCVCVCVCVCSIYMYTHNVATYINMTVLLTLVSYSIHWQRKLLKIRGPLC